MVFPTDAERKWIALIDQNKAENIGHHTQFGKDLSKIGALKAVALEQIASKVKSLKSLLYNLQEELEAEIIEGLKRRSSKIKENMESLVSHKDLNDDAKECSQDLLTGFVICNIHIVSFSDL